VTADGTGNQVFDVGVVLEGKLKAGRYLEGGRTYKRNLVRIFPSRLLGLQQVHLAVLGIKLVLERFALRFEQGIRL